MAQFDNGPKVSRPSAASENPLNAANLTPDTRQAQAPAAGDVIRQVAQILSTPPNPDVSAGVQQIARLARSRLAAA